jgi:hypothetical protein
MLGIEIEVCGMVLLLPFDVSLHVNCVEVDLLLNQYALLLVGMFNKWFPAIHSLSLIIYFEQFYGVLCASVFMSIVQNM